MKLLKQYINEWKLNDKTSDDVNISNINEFINELNSIKSYESIIFKNGIGFKADLKNCKYISLWYIWDALSKVSKTENINMINSIRMEYLKEKEIMILRLDRSSRYLESIDIFFKLFDHKYEYCSISFFIDNNVLNVICQLFNTFGDYLKNRIIKACKVTDNYAIVDLLNCIMKNNKNMSPAQISDNELKQIINCIK